MADEKEKDPKIIVDEDWKTQVQEEMDKLKTEEAGEASGGEETSPDSESNVEQSEPEQSTTAGAATSEPDAVEPQLPSASFSFLVTTLATQALIALGVAPDPVSGQAVVHKEHAKHFIDTLAVLEEKTRGNLDQDEAALLDGALHQLRMLFVEVK